jgi:hypothetical protein
MIRHHHTTITHGGKLQELGSSSDHQIKLLLPSIPSCNPPNPSPQWPDRHGHGRAETRVIDAHGRRSDLARSPNNENAFTKLQVRKAARPPDLRRRVAPAHQAAL